MDQGMELAFLDIKVELSGYWFGYIVGAYEGTPLNWFLFLLASTASLMLRRVWAAPLTIALVLVVAHFPPTDPENVKTSLGFAAPIAVYATLFHIFAVRVWRLLHAPRRSGRREEGNR